MYIISEYVYIKLLTHIFVWMTGCGPNEADDSDSAWEGGSINQSRLSLTYVLIPNRIVAGLEQCRAASTVDQPVEVCWQARLLALVLGRTELASGEHDLAAPADRPRERLL